MHSNSNSNSNSDSDSNSSPEVEDRNLPLRLSDIQIVKTICRKIFARLNLSVFFFFLFSFSNRNENRSTIIEEIEWHDAR